MFCPNCGKPCRDADMFCGSCGCKLPKATQAPKPVEKPVDKPAFTVLSEENSSTAYNTVSKPATEQGYAAKREGLDGVILTNSIALAKKLNTDTNVILQLLAAYSRAAAKRGICYSIMDAANYTMRNPKYEGKRVSLSPNDSWKDYATLLSDYYAHGRPTTVERTSYLFIVGGEDIVPMPVVKLYLANHPNFSDKDIDTDVPYAYLLGERTFDMLASGKIFEYEQYFHVGRLPFATDASLDDLAGYMRRVAECGGELKINRYYGQTNMPWGEESQVVCTPLRDAGLESAADEYKTSYVELENHKYGVTQGELFYSLPVCGSILDKVFDKEADFYYFNLHGSDQPTYSGFYADGTNKEAITPQHLASITSNNFFVTEACYGGRFQKYRRSESMLLSAMGSHTLLYLGSSRIAFCNNRYSIDNSDRLANIFIEELLAGASAGDALYAARKSFFEYDDGHLYDQQLTSIVEFNIFGDPTLKANTNGTKYNAPTTRSVVSKNAVQRVCESKCVYDSSDENRPKSVYEQVRQAVYNNLMKIRKVIDQELYEKLGVEPRSLSHIFHNRFADGKEFYSFDYTEQKENRTDLRCAITDKNGKIITVISTK